MKPVRLIKSLMYMFLSSGFVLVISIGITLVLAKLLSPRDLGILMSAEAFVELFIFIYTMGFRNSILKFTANHPEGFHEGLNVAVGNALVIRTIVLIPFSLIPFFIAPVFIHDPKELFVSQVYVLIYALSSKNIHQAREVITKLFLKGFLLDDILLVVEKGASLFPSSDPDSRFAVLHFTMLGWIYIQQGKEHWLDTMDILATIFQQTD